MDTYVFHMRWLLLPISNLPLYAFNAVKIHYYTNKHDTNTTLHDQTLLLNFIKYLSIEKYF
jgi:hypothetical protein